MSDNRADVSVLPTSYRADYRDRGLSYTKVESEAFHGKIFVGIHDGPIFGRVVGSHAYRFEDDVKILYSLEVECKFADDWKLWKGSWGRVELEEFQRVVMLNGKLADRVSEQLRVIEAPPKKLLREVARAVDRSQRLRMVADQGKGIGF